MEQLSYNEIEIPCYFLCPISMQLMKDPVTISTGITYDRENIEKWLFSCKNNATCPATKQHVLNTDDLTPNHTLRRLIQAWCTLNSFERIPTPKPAIEKSHILKLLKDAKNSPQSQITCLQKLRSIALRNEGCRSHFLQAAGAVEFLLSVVRSKNEDSSYEALTILQLMDLSDSDLKSFFQDNGEVLDAFMQVLETGTCENRARVIILLKSAFDVADPSHLIGSKPELFNQIVKILRDKISSQATKAALKLLVELCPWGRNRIKAVENDAVFVLIELLLDPTADRRACELILIVLDQLCGCADGRAELLRHGAGLAIVSKKILRVSHAASERAVKILGSISKYSSNFRVLQEMLQVGVVSKLCLVLQVDSGKRTKEKVNEILKMNSRVWKGSSCIPSHLLSSYPS